MLFEEKVELKNNPHHKEMCDIESNWREYHAITVMKLKVLELYLLPYACELSLFLQ